jgi:hypothetical protein
MTRAKRISASLDRDVQAAAYLRGEFQLSQAEIGRLLGGLSQSRVSRLLKLAESQHWLDVRYRFLGEDRLSAETLDEFRTLVEPQELLEVLRRIKAPTGVQVREVRVVDTGGLGESHRAIELRLGRLGRGAAVRVGALLQRSSVFAVTWGNTVSCIVDALEAAPPQLAHDVTFVPVCAEPYLRSSNKETSSHLVRRLHRLLQPNATAPLSITGVPALIPRKFTGEHESGIRKFINDAASYREIFGGPSPLIDRVDTLITSVGPADRPMGFIHDELLTAASLPDNEFTEARLTSLVAGDIGGVLIPRPGLGAEKAEVDALNQMWTGLQRKHLERIAKDAVRENRPGVIVVSLDRPEIVAEVIRQGLVNELIIDRPSTVKVAQLLKERN